MTWNAHWDLITTLTVGGAGRGGVQVQKQLFPLPSLLASQATPPFPVYLPCGASWSFRGQRPQSACSGSRVIRGLGRSPETWQANNALASCQAQLNLSLRISHGSDRLSPWSSETLGNELMFLARRCAGSVRSRDARANGLVRRPPRSRSVGGPLSR